jgi:hypothetical protein
MYSSYHYLKHAVLHLHSYTLGLWDASVLATFTCWYSTVCDLAALSPCLLLGRNVQNNQITVLPSNVFANLTSLTQLWVGMCCWCWYWLLCHYDLASLYSACSSRLKHCKLPHLWHHHFCMVIHRHIDTFSGCTYISTRTHKVCTMCSF